MRAVPTIPIAAAALALAYMLVACSPDVTPIARPMSTAPFASTSPTASSKAPSPSVSASEGPAVAPALAPTPSCEDLATPDVLASLNEGGFVPSASPFIIGEFTLDPGVQCLWTLPNVGTDAQTVHAWGLISNADAREAVAVLLAEGWRREDAVEGVYVTATLGGPWTDAEGYAHTYLFGDGWVMFSDVKAGLAEINRPA